MTRRAANPPVPPAPPALLLILLLLPLLLAGQGCDLFSTRDPEPPTTSGDTFEPATSPELVFSNLAHAISEKNVVNYMRCFGDTLAGARPFSFTPTAAAAGQYAATFASWTLASERSAFAALVAATPESSTPVLSLSGSFTAIAADSAVYGGTYSLTFPHGIAGVPETVRGSAQFTLTADRNSIWGIVRWIDLPMNTEPSWSDLKGRFAN